MNILLAQETQPGFYLYMGTALKAIVEGDTVKARAAIMAFEQTDITDAELWYYVAELYSGLGDVSNTARALEEGINRGYFNYPHMNSASWFKAFHRDPEFQRVIEKARIRYDAFLERFYP